MTSPLPRLTRSHAPLTQGIEALNEHGQRQAIQIPAERPLTVFVDKRELVTLMTLGAEPELLVLGYLRNQRLVASVHDIESITVDWDVAAAAVKTRAGIEDFDRKTARRVVTTGCGQGTVFGGLMDELDGVALPSAEQARISQRALYALLDAVRRQESTYKSAGSVHGCALFTLADDDATRAAAAVLAFGIALVFFVLWQAGNSLAASGGLPVMVAMFGANAVLAAGGAVLFGVVVRR